MPTKAEKSSKKGPSAAAVVRKHKPELIRKWTDMFPRARWTRKEAQKEAANYFEAYLSFLETGRASTADKTLKHILHLAVLKRSHFESGLRLISQARRQSLETLLKSKELRDEELRIGLTRTTEFYDRLDTRISDSAVRRTSEAEEILRKIPFHEGILRNPGVAIFAADSSGKIILWNEGAEEMSGIRGRVAIGRNLPKSIIPHGYDSLHISQKELSRVFSKLAKESKKKYKKKEFVATGSVSRIKDDLGTFLGTAAVAFDLTATEKARERLRRFAQIVENSRDAIIQTDAEGRVVYWNSGAVKLTGYSKKEAEGKTGLRFARWESPADYRKMLETVRSEGRWKGELVGLKKDGTEFNSLASVTAVYSKRGEHLGNIVIGTNITERRRAKERATEYQSLLQTILDSIDDLVAVTDQDRNLIFSNKAIKKLTGYDLEDYQMVGAPYYMMSETDKKPMDRMWEQLGKGKGPRRIVVSIPTKDGEERLVEWEAVKVEDKKRKEFKVVSVGRDITDRIRAEEESELLFDLSTSLSETLDLKQVLSEALKRTMEVFGADAGLLGRIDETTGRLHMLAQRGVEQSIVARLESRSRGEGWSGRVIRTGKPVLIQDVGKSGYEREAYPEATRAGYRSFVSLPLMVGDKVFGVLEMGSRHLGQFKKSDLKLGTSIAGVLSSAVHNAMLHSELEQSQQDLAEIAERLASAEEDERRRISAELHDETGQILAAAKVRMKMAARQLGSSNPKVRQALKETAELVSQSLEQVRNISHGLHPALLDDVGLAGAARWLAERTGRASGIRIGVKCSGLTARLPASVESSLFRVLQEILNNIARHSKATIATVELHGSDKAIRILVKDNGIGFDPTRESKRPKGLGLRTLNQRVRWLGGRLDLQSTKGKGTMVQIEIPTEEYGHEKH